MTRAQWAVLLRLERREGLKQSDSPRTLDIQPITLTRLVDRLCDNGLIERRADPNDRRAKRLYLTPAARPLLDRIADAGRGAGRDGARRHRRRPTIDLMLAQLGLARDNLKQAIDADTSAAPQDGEALWLSPPCKLVPDAPAIADGRASSLGEAMSRASGCA